MARFSLACLCFAFLGCGAAAPPVERGVSFRAELIVPREARAEAEEEEVVEPPSNAEIADALARAVIEGDIFAIRRADAVTVLAHDARTVVCIDGPEGRRIAAERAPPRDDKGKLGLYRAPTEEDRRDPHGNPSLASLRGIAPSSGPHVSGGCVEVAPVDEIVGVSLDTEGGIARIVVVPRGEPGVLEAWSVRAASTGMFRVGRQRRPADPERVARAFSEWPRPTARPEPGEPIPWPTDLPHGGGIWSAQRISEGGVVSAIGVSCAGSGECTSARVERN